MMKVIRNIGKGIVIILLISLAVISLPFAIVYSIVDIPASKKRKKRLEMIAEQKMLPVNKFLYIEYSLGKPLSDWIENDLLPKYEDFAVIEAWDNDKFEWREQTWNGLDKEDSRALVLELAADCEGLTTFSVTGINPATRRFDVENQLSVIGPPEDDYYTVYTGKPADEEKQPSEDEVKQLIRDNIEMLIASHDD